MKKVLCILFCVCLASMSYAAVITSQLEAPAVSVEDIAQLEGAANDTLNIGGVDGGTDAGANDGSTYVASDRNTQGQTFTVPVVTMLQGIWVRHVAYTTLVGNGTWANFSGDITVRVCSVSGTALTVLRREISTIATNSTFSSSGDMGTGRWIYIPLDAPVLLASNTTYAFDLTKTANHFEMSGLKAGPYAGGHAYSTSSKESMNMDVVHANGDRTFILNLAPGKVSPVAPAPGAVNVGVNQDLSWTINDAAITNVDLYFGTVNDPNLSLIPANKKLSMAPAATTTWDTGTLAYNTTYYWKVDAYEPNSLGGYNKIQGMVWSFTTKPEDLTPVVDAGDSIITTLALSSSPNVLTLHGSVVDDGTTPLTVNWQAYDVAFGGGLTTKVTFANQTDPNTTVTISESGTYILSLSATDGTGTVSDQKEIVVYDSDCDAAKATGTRVANYYDRDDNCVVNLLDFAVFASEWLDSTGLTESYLHSATVAAGTDNALVAEYWTGVSGTDPNSLLADSRYPASPNGSYLVVNQLSGSMTGDNYGQRIRGYIVPQTAGTYTFYIASDDGSRLFLSANTTPVDTNPALGNQIAEVPNGNWTDANVWTKFPEQKSAPVTLTAGQYYYVEILHKEGTGGENVSVGWSTDGGTTITVVPGTVLRYALP